MKISVPHNGDPALLKRLLEEFAPGEDFHEIYFPASPNICPTGRPRSAEDRNYGKRWGRLVYDQKSHEKQLKDLLELARENGVETNMLFNGLCLGLGFYAEKHLRKTKQYLQRFYSLGLDAVTVANPFLVKLLDLKQEFADMRIDASVNCFVQTPKKALFFKNMGFNAVTIDREINRDPKKISSIKNTGVLTKMLVNEGCLPDCPYRVAHMNAISHQGNLAEYCAGERNSLDEKTSVLIDSVHTYLGCGEDYAKDKSLFLKSPWVRPEDLYHYESLVDYVKLAGRMASTDQVLKTVKAYVTRSYEGNLCEITAKLDQRVWLDNKKIPKDFWEKTSCCGYACSECGYCESLAEELL